MLPVAPIPTHLKAIVSTAERFPELFGLSLSLATPAGAEFGVTYDTFEEDGPLLPGYPGAMSVNQSGQSWEVFDLSKHGHDAIAAGFRPDGPRIHHAWRCEACGDDLCRVKLALMYNNWDDPDFQSMEVTLEDCFDWITVDLTCSACGHEAGAFLEHECG